LSARAGVQQRNRDQHLEQRMVRVFSFSSNTAVPADQGPAIGRGENQLTE